MPGDHISQKTVVEDVLDHLKAMIHRGDIGPGGQLPPERVLAEQLGVGRLSLRAAIGELAAEGYVVSKRGAKGGTFVTELEKPFTDWVAAMRANPGTIDDILEMRIALEGRAAVLACRQKDHDAIAEMKDALSAFDETKSVMDKRFADNRFHHAVATASGSPRLIDALTENRGELFPPTHREMYQVLLSTAGTDHSEILDAIISGDEERAARAVVDHVEDTRGSLHALLEVESSEE